ncbi:MAG: hypothetical protein KY468_10465 [Armatimonadetes bacterium]|nr:hypothetical protein [Armatimonadota bacterium]
MRVKEDKESGVFFHEEQRFRQPWLWALLVGAGAMQVGVFGYGIVQQIVYGRPWGNRPMTDTLLLVVGAGVLFMTAGLLLLFYTVRLVTEVREDGLYVRFFPFHLRPNKAAPEDLLRWEAVTYSPLREYGGWGIRYGRNGKAYNVSGNRGVQLEFRDGRRILIGSQRPEELAAALDRITRR